MPKKILFIINPISGGGRQKIIESLVRQYLDANLFDLEIVYTQHQGHAIEISKKAAQEGYFAVGAVGGDGTVNEVARGLVHSNTAMCIIPTGSGNGFALYMGIPLITQQAIELLNNHSLRTIDTALVNGQRFVNVAGIGFDAHVAHIFHAYGKRGFWSYFKITTGEFSSFEPQNYRMVIDGKTYSRKVLLIAFANSSQFGNNANIAPEALIDDGMLDVAIMKKFPAIAAPSLGMRLFNQTMHRSKYMEVFKAKKIEVHYDLDIKAHLDGEPLVFGKQLNIEVDPLSLKVLVPNISL